MKTAAALVLATSLVSGAAGAVTVIYASTSHATSSANWSDALSFTKFDPSLGTLTSIKVLLNGNVNGTAKGESEDGEATTIVLNLGAKITLTRPDHTTIIITAPSIEESFDATAFDGDADFAGTSGVTYTNVSGTLSNSAILTSTTDLALFTGTGFLSAPVTAKGNSSGSGAGNLDTQFRTKAGAGGSVEYTYDTPTTGVPEPASWALIIAGLGMVGVAARRRKSGIVTA